jgi:hypothetical protein
MKKQQLIEKIEKSWAAFKDAYAGLPEDQLMERGVTGDWSIKDILAHVNAWEEEALKYLPHILEGGRTPRYSVLYGGIDAFNAQMTASKRQLTLAEVRGLVDETHRRLIDYLCCVPEEHFSSETRFRRRLRLDTYSHYPIHTQAILEWRERSG